MTKKQGSKPIEIIKVDITKKRLTRVEKETVKRQYKIDKHKRVHDKKGRYVKKSVQDRVTKIHSRTIRPVKEKDKTLKFKKGKMMRNTYAHYYVCTCYVIIPYRTEPKDLRGQTIKHHFAVSTNKKDVSSSEAIKNHNKHYPEHDLLEIDYRYTKELVV